MARRLKAESLALILATRPDERTERVTAGVARLELQRARRAVGGAPAQPVQTEPLDPYVAARIAEESVGNPLTLIDLGREVSAKELTTSSLTPVPVPVGTRLEAHYRREVDVLPATARRWLRVAAVESSGDAVTDRPGGRAARAPARCERRC